MRATDERRRSAAVVTIAEEDAMSVALPEKFATLAP
jgi:hypothetical protein